MLRIGHFRGNGLCRPVSQIVARSGDQLVTSRAASLSAIHRGVRRSERVEFGEPSTKGRGPFRRDRGSQLTVKAFDGASSPRQQQKLRKKLDRKAADDEKESGRQTRRKRFLDPASTFGKNSLVYQLKHGLLKDEAASLPLQEPVRPVSYRSHGPEGRQFRSPKPKERSPRSYESGERLFSSPRPKGRPFRSPRPEERLFRLPRSEGRPSGPHELGGRSLSSPRPEGRPFRSPRPKERPSRSYELEGRPLRSSEPEERFRQCTKNPNLAKPRSDIQEEDAFWDEEAPARGRKKPMMAMNIKYTTAASQFLYGKSVVKAALEQGRRALYNLYIYGGENRKDSKDNAIITRLAERHSTPVTIVPNGDQRLMDKMSMGRPHNGFILETSPLPQLPVKSLGRLEESPGKLGFYFELDYQSKEEEAINGRDTFVARKSDITPKPFVLLLNEILDPGNLGGMLRTASYLGVDAVGITNRSSSALTPVVLKSAAGAVEEITIFRVDSPEKFIEESKKAGWKTYAAVAPPELKLSRMHADKFVSTDNIEQDHPLANDPCILVLGNEGHGLPKPIKVAADYELSVPRFVQNSCIDSLNVSVAAGLLCHAFVKEPPTTDQSAAIAPEKKDADKVGSGAVEVAKPGEALF